jgi:hypothetical protein
MCVLAEPRGRLVTRRARRTRRDESPVLLSREDGEGPPDGEVACFEWGGPSSSSAPPGRRRLRKTGETSASSASSAWSSGHAESAENAERRNARERRKACHPEPRRRRRTPRRRVTRASNGEVLRRPLPLRGAGDSGRQAGPPRPPRTPRGSSDHAENSCTWIRTDPGSVEWIARPSSSSAVRSRMTV